MSDSEVRMSDSKTAVDGTAGGVLKDVPKKQIWKSTVAAGKQPTTNFDIVGIRIGQEQSTGDTSRVQKLRGIGTALREQQQLRMYNTFNGYLGPFRVNFSYVDDAKGRTVAECQDKATARVICDLLNEKYPKKADDASS